VSPTMDQFRLHPVKGLLVDQRLVGIVSTDPYLWRIVLNRGALRAGYYFAARYAMVLALAPLGPSEGTRVLVVLENLPNGGPVPRPTRRARNTSLIQLVCQRPYARVRIGVRAEEPLVSAPVKKCAISPA